MTAGASLVVTPVNKQECGPPWLVAEHKPTAGLTTGTRAQDETVAPVHIPDPRGSRNQYRRSLTGLAETLSGANRTTFASPRPGHRVGSLRITVIKWFMVSSATGSTASRKIRLTASLVLVIA